MMRLAKALVAAVLATAATATNGSTQQVLEIDLDNGRDVINDDLRAIHLSPVVIDQVRGHLYVRDLEEPDGIMAFSLASGERLQTYLIPKGDGPYELRQIFGFALSSDGGLYVTGGRRVLHLDALGDVIDYWQPRLPASSDVCEFGGQPTVTIEGGLRRRGSDGNDRAIGSSVVEADAWLVVEGDLYDHQKWEDAQVACNDQAAYVTWPNKQVRETKVVNNGTEIYYSNTGPDSVIAYYADGTEDRIHVPNEFAKDGWNENLDPSIDTHGDLVLASGNGHVPGAIVDPGTGCYGVIRNKEYQLHREFLGIYRDSAVVFHRDREEVNRGGQKFVTLYAEARQVSLNPIRRISGDPCPGMLPSLDDAGVPKRQRRE